MHCRGRCPHRPEKNTKSKEFKMELPKRKPNRLKEYDYSQNGAYFITICTKDRKQILSHITVGDDARIVPKIPRCNVGDDAYIVPKISRYNVGDDAHIVPRIKLTTIGEIAEKYLLRIQGVEKYIIMPDHIHLIILIDKDDGAMKASPPTNSISQCIKSFKIMVTKELGYPIFQRSYFDHIIRNRQDYEETCKYIDENPMKWLAKM